MRGLIDLHCHWVSAIDDGVRSEEAGIAMLAALASAGFSAVYATPHMRVGMFENDHRALRAAYARMLPAIAKARAAGQALPETRLASEHFFDDVVFERLRRGEGLPYPPLDGLDGLDALRAPGGDADASPQSSEPRAWHPANPSHRRGVLVEIPPERFPMRLAERFSDLRRAGLVVTLAHPERYAPVWADDACLDPILDAGVHLLLDVCALVGKYGRASEKAALKLLEDGAYEAACSDAHKPADVDTVVQAIERLEKLAGKEEAARLFVAGPKRIIDGL